MSNDKFKAAEGIRVREIGEETLVLNDRNGQVHQLNTTATFIWRQLDGATSISVIATRLVERFDVDDAVAAGDVAAIVDTLRELKLLDD